MTDQTLPSFDSDPTIQETPAPKKSRPRPQRKRPTKKAVKRVAPPKLAKRVPKKRRVRKAILPKQIVPVTHAGGLFTPEVYQAIGRLMEMKLPDRSLVLSIVDSLSGHK